MGSGVEAEARNGARSGARDKAGGRAEAAEAAQAAPSRAPEPRPAPQARAGGFLLPRPPGLAGPKAGSAEWASVRGSLEPLPACGEPAPSRLSRLLASLLHPHLM